MAELLVVFALIALNGFFAMSEMAVMTASRLVWLKRIWLRRAQPPPKSCSTRPVRLCWSAWS